MSYIVVDVEADWPCPWLYSMVSFWAVIVEDTLTRTFYGEVAPITDNFDPVALSISWFSREEHLQFNNSEDVMLKFFKWVERNSIWPNVFASDNLAFDWQFINYYFHKYVGENPFWHSWIRVGDLYCWMEKTMKVKNDWKKKYSFTKHTHNPVDDAKGVAECLISFKNMWLDINLV